MIYYQILDCLVCAYLIGSLITIILTIFCYQKEKVEENGNFDWGAFKDPFYYGFLLFTGALSWYWLWLMTKTVKKDNKG